MQRTIKSNAVMVEALFISNRKQLGALQWRCTGEALALYHDLTVAFSLCTETGLSMLRKYTKKSLCIYRSC